MASTQNATLVESALKKLQFEELPGPPGKEGEPPKFKVTHATIEYLRGKTITVNGDGTVDAK